MWSSTAVAGDAIAGSVVVGALSILIISALVTVALLSVLCLRRRTLGRCSVLHGHKLYSLVLALPQFTHFYIYIYIL